MAGLLGIPGMVAEPDHKEFLDIPWGGANINVWPRVESKFQCPEMSLTFHLISQFCSAYLCDN